MFKIKNNTIHCSRGDTGIIKLRIPITDTNDYIKYKDTEENVYWYDINKKKVYNSNYEEVEISLDDLTIVCYQFVVGDKIQLNIYEIKGYDKEPLRVKIVEVETSGETIDILLTEEDTTFCKISNKPVMFWYDITLNNDKTVVCYNEDGAKEFIIYPAKGDEE